MPSSLPFDPDFDLEIEGTGCVTGFEPPATDRETLLKALALNRKVLYGNYPEVEVDEEAVRETIDVLLDKLNETQ